MERTGLLRTTFVNNDTTNGLPLKDKGSIENVKHQFLDGFSKEKGGK